MYSTLIRCAAVALFASVAFLTTSAAPASAEDCTWCVQPAPAVSHAAKQPRRGHGIPFQNVSTARGGASLTTVDCAGVPVRVASSASWKFSGFCADMASAGYRADPNRTAGYRPGGSCRLCDLHPRGLAIDYSQIARDRVSVRMDRAEVSRIAARHGLVSGGDWCHGDLGHFEVDVGNNAPACSSRTASARKKKHHRVEASAM